MGEAKRKRDKEYQEYLKSLNNDYFSKLREEIYPQKDSFGLIPNTWYVMKRGSRSVAYYTGEGKRTIGINPLFHKGLSVISSSAWFTHVNMRADNVVPANVERNILPKLIACAKEFGFHPGRMLLRRADVKVLFILDEDGFFLTNGILYCTVKEPGLPSYEIPLIKHSQWNVTEYKPV